MPPEATERRDDEMMLPMSVTLVFDTLSYALLDYMFG